MIPDADLLGRAFDLARQLPSWLKDSGTTTEKRAVDRVKFIQCVFRLAVAQQEFERAFEGLDEKTQADLADPGR